MGKKTILALLLLLVVLALSAPAWAESALVTGDEVNLREGPGTGFRILTSVPGGETVTVIDRSNASWYYVRYYEAAGFMSSAFLQVQEEQDPEAGSLADAIRGRLGDGQPGYVNAMYVRFRSAPGSEYSVLGEYNRGKELSYYGTFGEWAACIIDGQPGFLYADYIALGSFSGWSGGETVPGDAEPTPAWSWQDEAYEAEQEMTVTEQLALEHAAQPESVQYEGIIIADYVRFRTGPGAEFPIIETCAAGTVISVTGVYRDWTAGIINGQFGFVYSDFVGEAEPEADVQAWEQTEAEVLAVDDSVNVPMPQTIVSAVQGYVSGNSVRMRSAPSMAASIVTELSYGSAVTIVGYTGEWTAAINNGRCGYIYSSYVSQGSFQIADASGAAAALGGTSYQKGLQIAQYAMSFVGSPYCWGGRDPSTGFDCSGLVWYVYQHFGIPVNRVAQDQAENGVAVSLEELQPGDILCFYSGSSYIGHSGIYLGNGMFIHAQNSATGVVVTELAGHYAERGFLARRLV